MGSSKNFTTYSLSFWLAYAHKFLEYASGKDLLYVNIF